MRKQGSALRKKRLKSHSHESWHPRSTPTSSAMSGASQMCCEEKVIQSPNSKTTSSKLVLVVGGTGGVGMHFLLLFTNSFIGVFRLI